MKDEIFKGLLTAWGVDLANWNQNKNDAASPSPSSVAASPTVASPAVSAPSSGGKDGAGENYMCLQCVSLD